MADMEAVLVNFGFESDDPDQKTKAHRHKDPADHSGNPGTPPIAGLDKLPTCRNHTDGRSQQEQRQQQAPRC